MRRLARSIRTTPPRDDGEEDRTVH